VVGRVESVWRYPVKSMRGESLAEAFAGFPGFFGDRVWAIRSSAAPKGFPYFTGREQPEMLLYTARFRDPGSLTRPSNLTEAEALGPGVTPMYPGISELAVDVVTPSGEVLAIDDPRLIERLKRGTREAHTLSLVGSARALTDCRPVSLISIQTASALNADPRRFRANIYVDLASGEPFGEDALVGRRLRIGAKAVVAVTDRDPRCKMITLDPDTGEANPDLIRKVTVEREGMVGVYGAVLVEGVIQPGDKIALLDAA
jgi:uncharacterized protein YcbX